MRKISATKWAVVCVAAALALGSAWGQEAAFLGSNGAMRYVEAPGYYHYVLPCAVKAADTAGDAAKTRPPVAVCWSVYGGLRLKEDGTPNDAKPTAGVMLVSQDVVEFIPTNGGSAGTAVQFAPKEIVYSFDEGSLVASLKTPVGTYSFVFQAICDGCKQGTPLLDLTKKDQLRGEYAEFEKSLTEFKVVYSKVSLRSAAFNAVINPKDQPGPGDVPEAMGLYGDFNKKLAALCAEPARACVTKYSEYQECKKNNANAECGEAPMCEAACGVTMNDLLMTGATVCRLQGANMTFGPSSWQVGVKMAERVKAAQPAYKPEMSASDAGKFDDARGCSVNHTIDKAMAMNNGRGTGGVGGMGVAGGVIGMMQPIAQGVGASGGGKPVRVSSGVAASLILTKVDPVYPAAAKAAHISGTVLLHVRISKTGDIEDLSVISGPAMLQASAMDAVKQWKYKPFLLNGTPVEVETQINVVFSFGAAAPAVPPVEP